MPNMLCQREDVSLSTQMVRHSQSGIVWGIFSFKHLLQQYNVNWYGPMMLTNSMYSDQHTRFMITKYRCAHGSCPCFEGGGSKINLGCTHHHCTIDPMNHWNLCLADGGMSFSHRVHVSLSIQFNPFTIDKNSIKLDENIRT
jgi:hypothetical protein